MLRRLGKSRIHMVDTFAFYASVISISEAGQKGKHCQVILVKRHAGLGHNLGRLARSALKGLAGSESCKRLMQGAQASYARSAPFCSLSREPASGHGPYRLGNAILHALTHVFRLLCVDAVWWGAESHGSSSGCAVLAVDNMLTRRNLIQLA